MKKSALQCLILTCLFVAALCQWNTYVKMSMTWFQARDYCMEKHIDLTLIINENEDKDLRHYNATTAWIGLRKNKNDEWKWAGGENATFFRWVPGTPRHLDETCVVYSVTGWHNNTCEQRHNFFCSTNSSLVLVKEKKTWEEAMEHCRDQNKDLVSLPSESALRETLAAIREAQTDRVWTGLRYLGDSWLWVSAQPVSYLGASSYVQTPECPGWIHRCGALLLNGKTVEGWDCADKLNFVCDNNTLS